MSQNPIRLYSNISDHVSPAHEIVETILDKLPEYKKVTAKIPSVGKVTISLEESDEDEDTES